MARQELAIAVRERRRELQLSELALAQASGVSHMTVRRVEAGEPVRARSVSGLDAALGWRPGRTAQLLGQVTAQVPESTTSLRSLSERELAELLGKVTDEVGRRLRRRGETT